MLLKQNFLIFSDSINFLSSDPFKSLLQTEDTTNVDPLKYVKDFLKNQSNTCYSEYMLYRLYALNTLFYILDEFKINKIDANKHFLQLPENMQHMQKLFKIMSKLEQEDLGELVKLNNRIISNFFKFFTENHS